MRDGYLRGALSPKATQRQTDVLAAYVAVGGSVRTRPNSWAFGRARRSVTSPTCVPGPASRLSS
jgi:hypothetical protein